MAPLYPRVMGPAWGSLAPTVQSFFAASAARRRARGTFHVRRGSGLLARVLGRLVGLPPAAEATPVDLEVSVDAGGEQWSRSFAGVPMITAQEAGAAGVLLERFAGCEVAFRLACEDAALVFHQVGAAVRLGAARLPLPRFLAPRIRARAWEESGRLRTEVAITAPVVGLLVAYEGAIDTGAP